MTNYQFPAPKKFNDIREKHSNHFGGMTDEEIQKVMVKVFETRTMHGVSSYTDKCEEDKPAPAIVWATVDGVEFGLTINAHLLKKGIVKFIGVYPIWNSKRNYMIKTYNMRRVVKK